MKVPKPPIDETPAYEADDGPLTDEQHAAILRYAKDRLFTGKRSVRTSLFTSTLQPSDKQKK